AQTGQGGWTPRLPHHPGSDRDRQPVLRDGKNSIAVAVNGENGPIAAINITWPARRAVVEEVALRHLSSLQGIAARIGALVDGSSFARGPPDDEAGSEGRQGALSGDGMKAWILRKGATSLDAMQLVEQDAPVAGAGEVLIRVRACSLNYRDQMIPLGLYMGGPVTQDIVPPSDGAGEIVAVGEGVTRFSVGDRGAGDFFPKKRE
ncbi:hypothetical protein E4T56_gene5916, partial [Termitomyces sp. T112]